MKSSAEDVSRRLYLLLDNTGHSMYMVKLRRLLYRNIPLLLKSTNGTRSIMSGSKGDGISRQCDGDFDLLVVFQHYTCTHDVYSSQAVSGETNVFTIHISHFGYCTLELTRRGKYLCHEIKDSLVVYNGKHFLSSRMFNAENMVMHIGEVKQTGPAQTVTYGPLIAVDNVPTLTCDCQHILLKWASRPRKYDWPPLSLRQTISHMNGNLVAKGMKGSETEHLEWRYCFNEIESLILESLNDTQTKLYMMLKIINRDVIQKHVFSVSSFILKNIVFWLAETFEQHMFRPETLFTWIVRSLLLLKRAVQLNYLPYYMIPERNLLPEKVKEFERLPLIQTLSDILKSGPGVFYTCDSIKRYDCLNLKELKLLRQKFKKEVHLGLIYLYSQYWRTLLNGHEIDPETDEQYKHNVNDLNEQLRSGWPTSIQKKIAECKDYDEISRLLLT